jgi:hypothetical protein
METVKDFEKDLISHDDKKIESRLEGTVISSLEAVKYYFQELGTKEKDFISPVRMSERFIVNSEYFFVILQILAQNFRDTNNRSRYYFRGESTSEYKLLPSLLRDNIYESLQLIHKASNPIELQKKLLDRFRRYTQHIIHSDNDFKAPIWADFDTLCLAQHFGLPTLLMDWTLNPYVAAYFAVSNAYRRVLREKLGALPEMEHYYIRIWVMRLKDPDSRKDFTMHLEDRNNKWDHHLESTHSQPIAPLVVVPLVFTRRIAAQVGRFIYCGYMANTQNKFNENNTISLSEYSVKCIHPYDKNLSWDQLFSLDVKFDISETIEKFGRSKFEQLLNSQKKEKKLDLFNLELMKILRELDFIGFNAGRLFPDLEGWARYLKEGNL